MTTNLFEVLNSESEQPADTIQTGAPDSSTRSAKKNQRRKERREKAKQELASKVLYLCQRSFSDEKRAYNQKFQYNRPVKPPCMIRSRAFHTLSNRSTLEECLINTRLCSSVGTNIPCRHGSGCRFAHSENELVVQHCLFGSKCRFVRTDQNGVLVNVGKKVCKHQHAEENREEFLERIRDHKERDVGAKRLRIEII